MLVLRPFYAEVIIGACVYKKRTITEEVLVKENDRPVQVTTMPFQNDEGEWLVAEVNTDISKRKEAEEEKTKTMAETERMNKLMMGREKRVIEMKREVNALLGELGREPQYQSVLKDEAVVSSDKTE